MDETKESKKPFGILLVVTFWILLAIPFFYFSSYLHYSFFQLILILIGTSLILLGWGLLTYKKYALYISVLLCLLGIIPNIYVLQALPWIILSGSTNPIILLSFLIFLPFIPILIYQLIISSKYFEISTDIIKKKLGRRFF